MPVLRRPRSLRSQLGITIAVIVAVLSTTSGVLSYFTARHFLVVDQQSSLEHQAFHAASAIHHQLSSGSSPSEIMSSLSLDPGQTAGLFVGQTWYISGKLTVATAFSPSIRQDMANHDSAVQTTRIRDVPHFVVAVPFDLSGGGFILNTNLANLQHTLDVLFGALLGASLLIISLGAIAGVLAARRSMTPLQQVARAARAIASGDLEARLPDRKGDADLEGLSASFNEMAERLAERIERDSRFASDVSHEMRSPLTSMIGALNIVERNTQSADAQTREAVALFSDEVRRFERLLQDLIELARLESSTVALSVEDVVVGNLMNQSVASFSRSHPDVALPVVTFDDGVADAVIVVDKRRFERIIGNLLENAAQYAGGPKQIVLEQTKTQLTISVIDAGPGISDLDLPFVFDRFYRGATSGKRLSGEGSGLGLAIVASQVAHLGGTIRLENHGTGLRATLVLPIAEEPSHG